MIICYEYKRAYAKLVAQFEAVDGAESGSMDFDTFYVVAVADLLAQHLSVLFKKHDAVEVQQELELLLDLGGQKQKFGAYADKQAAYQFFHKILNKNQAYFQEVFKDKLGDKDQSFLVDFIEFTCFMVTSHLELLKEEVNCADGLQGKSYFQNVETLKEKKIKKLKKKYDNQLQLRFHELTLSGNFSDFQLSVARYIVSYYTSVLFAQADKVEVVSSLFQESSRLSKSSIKAQIKSPNDHPDYLTALVIMRALLSNKMSAFFAVLNSNSSISEMGVAKKANYFQFVRQVFAMLLGNITDNTKLSPQESGKLAELLPAPGSKKVAIEEEVALRRSNRKRGAPVSFSTAHMYSPSRSNSVKDSSDRRSKRPKTQSVRFKLSGVC